jgi:hypothetical protein
MNSFIIIDGYPFCFCVKLVNVKGIGVYPFYVSRSSSALSGPKLNEVETDLISVFSCFVSFHCVDSFIQKTS